jgi:hypothetical protein
MKIGGVEVSPCEELLVLPRTDGPDIPIRAVAVAINEELDKKDPEPTPPMILKKGEKHPDYTDKAYLEACKLRGRRRFALMVIRSLAPSNIEWDTVDVDKPTTWLKWEKELQDAGLSETECNRIINLVMAANSLDEAKIAAARATFLRGQGE